jgi:DNA mismatch endonuclease (patch repair protein)
MKRPSFVGLSSSSPLASRIKSGNRKTDTTVELTLRRALFGLGGRFRVNKADLPGKPDIVFVRSKVAVFCDGDFWHGRRWRERKQALAQGHNAPYWVAKISSNMARDRQINQLLRDDGWLVLRFWGTDIIRDPVATAHKVLAAVDRRNAQL